MDHILKTIVCGGKKEPILLCEGKKGAADTVLVDIFFQFLQHQLRFLYHNNNNNQNITFTSSCHIISLKSTL